MHHHLIILSIMEFVCLRPLASAVCFLIRVFIFSMRLPVLKDGITSENRMDIDNALQA
jgi:hypothetical protein